MYFILFSIITILDLGISMNKLDKFNIILLDKLIHKLIDKSIDRLCHILLDLLWSILLDKSIKELEAFKELLNTT